MCSSVIAMPPSGVAPWQLMSYVADVRATDGSIAPVPDSMLWSKDSCDSSGICAALRNSADGRELQRRSSAGLSVQSYPRDASLVARQHSCS